MTGFGAPVDFLKSTSFVDSDHPAIIAFSQAKTDSAQSAMRSETRFPMNSTSITVQRALIERAAFFTQEEASALARLPYSRHAPEQ
jgi:hypothetical protein